MPDDDYVPPDLNFVTNVQLFEELKRRASALVIGFDPLGEQGKYFVTQSGNKLVCAGLLRDIALDNSKHLQHETEDESTAPPTDDPDYKPPELNPELEKFDDGDLLNEVKARSLAFVFGMVSKDRLGHFRVHRSGWKLLNAGLIRTLQLDSDDDMRRTLSEPPGEGN